MKSIFNLITIGFVFTSVAACGGFDSTDSVEGSSSELASSMRAEPGPDSEECGSQPAGDTTGEVASFALIREGADLDGGSTADAAPKLDVVPVTIGQESVPSFFGTHLWTTPLTPNTYVQTAGRPCNPLTRNIVEAVCYTQYGRPVQCMTVSIPMFLRPTEYETFTMDKREGRFVHGHRRLTIEEAKTHAEEQFALYIQNPTLFHSTVSGPRQ